jgi:glucose/arabinose dehydrogenase
MFITRYRCGHLVELALVGALVAGCGGGGSGGGDTQVPTVTLTAPANFADNLSGTLILSATASDDVGVASVEFQVDGKTLATTSSGPPYQAPLTTAEFTSGQHVVRARSRDTAGNVSAWASATVRFGGAVGAPAGFTKNEAWVSSLSAATAFAQAPDGRLFVAEQGGNLRIVLANGTLLPTPFLSIVVSGDFASTERGLLGVALHPNFPTSPFVYVYYTTGTVPIHNRVSRFTVNPSNPNVASVGSEVPILDLPNLVATNHNGGAIHFSTDGKLYVGVGDNANTATSQDLNSPLGKLLRINDDGTIPTDNPFCNTPALQRCTVWARGLRNPFTFAVQPVTGTIYINDVGQNTWEEINVGAAGANFGWPASEGPDNVTAGITDGPLFAYKHSAAVPAGSGPGGFFTGFSIAGGAFYPSSGAAAVFPGEYRGNYFFADFVSRFVGRLDLANGNANDKAAYAFANLAGNPVDLLAGLDGALYILTRTAITRISTP